MPFTPLFRRHLAVLAGWSALIMLAGCERHAVVELSGPPDLVKDGKADPHALALPVRIFHVNHVWAGAGYEADGHDYRAKVTVWTNSSGEPPLAEFYFHDTERFEPAGRHKSSEPGTGPHQIHFPMSTFGPILALMRSANEPVYLFYFRGRWAIGTSLAEAIGSE